MSGAAHSRTQPPAAAAGVSPIVHIRIDDRLIHGQVATMWTNHLAATRIMVIDDNAATDSVLKMSLRMATPNETALSVLPLSRAVERLLAGAYEGQRLFLILKSPRTPAAMIRSGVPVGTVNVGNLTFEPGKVKISNTVAVSDSEIREFHDLAGLGVRITLQLSPTNPVEDFMAAMSQAIDST